MTRTAHIPVRARTNAPFNVAVLGTGISATVFHIPFVLALPDIFRLHTIVDNNPKSLAKAHEQYGVHTTARYEDVIADPGMDLIIICTPNGTHFPIARAALLAGKHVILEKPMCTSSRDADALMALARTHGLVLAPFHNRRFDSDFLQLSSLLRENKLGQLSELETRYDRWRPAVKGGGIWKETGEWGTGALWSLGSHLIDQALTLFGRPTKLFADVRNARGLGDPDLCDAFDATFFYPDRLLTVHIAGSSLSSVEPQVRFIARGTGGSWVKHGMDAQEGQRLAKSPMALDDPKFGLEDASTWGVFHAPDGMSHPTPSPRGSYMDWWKAAAAAFRANDEKLLANSPESARDVIRAIELMYRSTAEERVVYWSDHDSEL